MKTQSIGLFFCVLLCSSMAHDWQRGQESLLEAKAHRQLRSANPKLLDLAKLVQSNAEEDAVETRMDKLQMRGGRPNVSYYCSRTKSNIIGVLSWYKLIYVFLVIINLTTNYAIIIDIATSRVLCCNGNNGTAILININTGVCKYVPSKSWVSSITIKVWIETCDLIAIEALTTNIVIDISSPGSTVLGLCQNILLNLDLDLGLQGVMKPNGGLNILITICTEIITILTVNLLGLILLVVADVVLIPNGGGLLVFIEILRGLVDLCVTSNLTVANLVAAGIIIEIQRLLTASDGVSCFVYVANLIGKKYDLVIILNVVITNITILLRICGRLGGNSNNGINGAIRVIAAIYALVAGSINLDALILIILNVCANVNGVISIIVVLDLLQSLIDDQILNWKNETGLLILIGLVNDLRGNKLSLLNINISLILSTVCGGVITTVLDLVITVVALLTVYSPITVPCYWATLLRVILNLLNNLTGRLLINILLPILNIQIDYVTVCLNLLAGLLILLSEVLSTLDLLGLVAALKLVPITNSIYNLCANAISAKTGKQLDLLLGDSSAGNEVGKMSSWLRGCTSLCS